MQIVSLHFKNLNSLKGEFKIDFTKPELANAGLFAITGPTGAGKSTILDSITLALYSYTPRLGDINKSTIAEKGVVVTKHTKEAFAHIVFEANGDIYKAEWAISTTNRGNWGDVKHTLSQEKNGVFEVIADKKSDTYKLVTKVIRLDENQFTKAIILSQGKFDEFLKADKNKRYELLEIITGTQIYREIGKKVYEALKLVNERVDALNQQKGGIELLTDAQISEMLEKKLSIEVLVTKLRPEIEKLEKARLIKTQVKELFAEKAMIDDQLKQLQINTAQFKPQLEKLANHEKALPLQVDYNKWESISTDINQTAQSVSGLQDVLNNLLKSKAALIHRLADDIKESVVEENFISQLESFANRVVGLDKQITALEATVKARIGSLKSLYEQIPAASVEDIKTIRSSVTELQSYINASDDQINQLALPADFDGVSFDRFIDDLLVKKSSYTNAISLKADISNLIHSKEQQAHHLSELDKVIAETEKEKEKIQGRSNQLSNEIILLQQAFDANEALKQLDDYRDLLEDGKPCPCCGSLEHPYANNLPKVADQLEEKLIQKKAEAEDYAKAIRTLQDNLLVQGTQRENVVKENENTDRSITDSTESFHALCSELQLSAAITVDELNNEASLIEKNISSLRSHKIWNATKVPLLSYIEHLSVYNEENANLKSLAAERVALFGDKIIEAYKNELSLGWNNVNRDIAANELKLRELIAKKENAEKEYIILNQGLINKVSAIGLDSIASLKSALLTDADLKLIKDKNEQLKNAQIELNTKQKTNIVQYEKAKQEDDDNIGFEDLIAEINTKKQLRDDQLKEQGDYDRQLLNNERNLTKVNDILNAMETLKVEQGYYKTLSDLIGDQTGNKFNNIIQRITLRHLFNMTNARLLTLMDRYQVDLGGDGQEDEIWVIDTYMGNEKRTINSVSGGERFVISLAMALSLSDLASNNVRLDSVFIDEGFGSLSPDDLDNSITMLERMQIESEKTIGIISHVESLKERISTQILVEKLHNGESTISLKSNGQLTSLAVS